MSFFRHHVYPHLVDRLGDPPPIQKIRRQIIRWAQGTVLEIGVGSGSNFVHYDPTSVRKLYALEPNQGMIRLAERQRERAKLNIEFLNLPGERIPLEPGTIDTVVSTFTLWWFSDRADRGGASSPISQVVVTLLVGYGDSQSPGREAP